MAKSQDPIEKLLDEIDFKDLSAKEISGPVINKGKKIKRVLPMS